MGMHVGYIATRSNEDERLLDLTNKYYEQFGLSLVQERVGQVNGKYVLSPKHYKDLNEYDRINTTPSSAKADFSTNFDFYENLDENKGWLVFMYIPGLVRHPLNINYALASLLSKELNTTSLEYYRYDVPSLVILRLHESGISKDTFYVADFNLLETSGYFEQFKDRVLDNYTEVLGIPRAYLKKVGFNPEAEEFSPSNENSRHPMYLKGKPEGIMNFLTSKQQTF